MKGRRFSTISGMCKILQVELMNISQDTILSVYASWKRRLRMVDERNGGHIENVKKLNRRNRSNKKLH
jgi:hypothetical protein